jgi:hypothetical protein
VRVFADVGFTLSRRMAISHPWPGEQICFRRPFA